MSFIAGIFIAVSALALSVWHLNQEASSFVDFVGFATVFGGTVAVAVITIPWQHRRLVFQSLRGLFISNQQNGSSIVADCVAFLSDLRSGTPVVVEKSAGLAGETMRDGAEFIALGFSKDRIHEILEERIHQSYERQESVANAFRSLAKYPPAFGLAGTVLGLVTLMKSVATGADAKQTGALMAIALMATFYGLLVANMVVNPAGEHMLKTARIEKKKAEVALHSVLLHLEGVSMLEAQEILNSYVSAANRVNVMSGPLGSESAAAA